MSDSHIGGRESPWNDGAENEEMMKGMIEWADVDGLRVASVGAVGAPVNVLVFMGLAACVDSFEVARFGVLAAEWNARVTVVDTPGRGFGGGTLDRSERSGLRRGDFTPVARRMVHAANIFDHTIMDRPVTVIGYSLGTSIAAAAAADPGLLRVEHLIAVEPVATRTWNPLRLMSKARAEDTFVPAYRMKNANYADSSVRSGFPDSVVPTSKADLARLGYALSRGTLKRDLLRASRVQQFNLQIVHGSDSMLSSADDAARIAASCRRSGLNVRDVLVEGRHALWQSLPDVAAIARETRKSWT